MRLLGTVQPRGRRSLTAASAGLCMTRATRWRSLSQSCPRRSCARNSTCIPRRRGMRPASRVGSRRSDGTAVSCSPWCGRRARWQRIWNGCPIPDGTDDRDSVRPPSFRSARWATSHRLLRRSRTPGRPADGHRRLRSRLRMPGFRATHVQHITCGCLPGAHHMHAAHPSPPRRSPGVCSDCSNGNFGPKRA